MFLYVFLIYRYINYVADVFNYMRFEFKPSFMKSCLAGVAFIVVLRWLYIIKDKFMYAVCICYATLLIIPNLIMFQFNSYPPFLLGILLLFLFWLSREQKTIYRLNVAKIRESNKLALILIIVLITLVPFLLSYGINLNFELFSFGEVIYEAREDSKGNESVLTSYLYSPLKNVLIPTLIIIGLYKRKPVVIIVGIIMLVYLFLVIPHKTTFFSIFVVLALFFYNDYYKKMTFMLSAISVILLLSFIINLNYGVHLIESMFLRRVFFVPAQLNMAYVEVFKQNPIYLSHSILGWLIDYPFKIPPTYVLGIEYYGDETLNANNGVFSDGFMNFGFIGSFFFTYFTVWLIRFIKLIRIAPYLFGIVFIVIQTTISSALLTGLLTHGILVTLGIFIFFFKDSEKIILWRR